MVSTTVPELYEDEYLASVETRTELLQTLRELGPPDLCHLTRQGNKANSKPVGIFHSVTGVDASSSASLAAYVNTLVSSPQDRHGKIVSGLFCCYNAFSRLDMRVRISIPGSMESYCVDERGDKRVTSDALWLETYLCSVLRSFAYADDGTGEAIMRVVGCRRMNPITNTESEHRFLDAAEKLFFQGWQLGSEPDIQVPNLVSNHLTTGLLKYITTTGRYASGINLFEKLRQKDQEISSLLAQVYIHADEEVKAVRLLNETLQKLPMDYALLDTQAYFCRRKGRSDLAVEIAKRSVISAPSEFVTWSKLVQTYIDLEQYDLALLTLNSCPMFTYQDKDVPPPPPAEKIQLPVMPETMFDEIGNPGDPVNLDLVPQHLRKLIASTFKGTFQKAYALLTDITKRIGWDELLRIRSKVFVMEEEYRHEKSGPSKATSTDPPKPTQMNGENGTSEESGASPNASTTGIVGDDSTGLERPSQTVTAAAAHAGSDNVEADVDPSHSSYTGFSHKRLCERWLDNLFMVLYDDLRAFTMWRTDMTQYRQQQINYSKSAEEWEILADLSRRLHHEKEELEAWQHCLNVRFSPRAMSGVLRAWQKDNNVRDSIGALIRLICWQYRWHSEYSPNLFLILRRLIEEEGSLKVTSIVRATGLPDNVLSLTNAYIETCASFRSNGIDG